MKILVTGADGFVGRHLVARLVETGHQVSAACRPGGEPVDSWLGARWRDAVETVPLEITDPSSVRAALNVPVDGIVHLAAVAYSQEAKSDPSQAWSVNAEGTARLLAAAAKQRLPNSAGPLVIVASSAEVYGEGESQPRRETDATRPSSVYGWSKLGAEAAAGHAVVAWGLRVIVVRPFPATGPGQTNRLVPNWLSALRAGQREIDGDPAIVRDYVDVRDTAEAYLALLGSGRPGETYNLATGHELRFSDLFTRLTEALGVSAQLVPPTGPPRSGIVHLVGDPRKLQQHTGWEPIIPLEQTLADLIDAQAH